MCQVNDVECLKKKTRKDLADSVAVFEKDVREGRGPLRHYLLYNKKCVHGRDVYLECVYQGYLDAARRFAGIENIPNYKSLLFDIFADIAGGICFFTKDITTERQYDEWHNKTCMIIIQMLNARGYAAVTYGMAQKIVNMAMKYLYLVEKPAKDFLWQFWPKRDTIRGEPLCPRRNPPV